MTTVNRVDVLQLSPPVERASRGLGRFQLLDEVGSVGAGVAYRAHDPAMDRDVAIEIVTIPPGTRDVDRKALLARFQEAAAAAATLHHPAIVPVYEHGDDFVVTELCEGRTLRDVLRGGRLTFWRSVSILEQIADALDHAHRMAVIHRDLSADNIVVGVNDRVRVADFGISRVLTRGTVGDAGSLAPEQVVGKPSTPATDVFAMSAIAYELSTGMRPFRGPIADVLDAIVHEEPVPASRANPELPSGIDPILARGLAKDPAKRPATAHEVVRALRAAILSDVLAPEPGIPPVGEPPSSSAERISIERVRPAVVLVPIGAAVALAIFAIASVRLAVRATSLRGAEVARPPIGAPSVESSSPAPIPPPEGADAPPAIGSEAGPPPGAPRGAANQGSIVAGLASAVPGVVFASSPAPEVGGLAIARVTAGSPAAIAGLRPDDVVVRYAGVPLKTVTDTPPKLAGEVEVVYLRREGDAFVERRTKLQIPTEVSTGWQP